MPKCCSPLLCLQIHKLDIAFCLFYILFISFLKFVFFVIPFKNFSSLSIIYSDFIFILTIWINRILSSLFWKLCILFLIPMVVSLEHTCLNYQYLILINTFILFQETAIIWKLVIPFTLSWFNVLLLWYIFRSLSFKIKKTLFLSVYAIILRFYPWIYLSLFSFLLFKHLRPFCLESFCLLLEYIF